MYCYIRNCFVLDPYLDLNTKNLGFVFGFEISSSRLPFLQKNLGSLRIRIRSTDAEKDQIVFL
jgi:hypothetical protein